LVSKEFLCIGSKELLDLLYHWQIS